MGFRVWGLGFRVQVPAEAQSLGLKRAWGFGYRAWGLWAWRSFGVKKGAQGFGALGFQRLWVNAKPYELNRKRPSSVKYAALTRALLEGSGVVISRVISGVALVLTLLRVLITTLLVSSHEPPSISP